MAKAGHIEHLRYAIEVNCAGGWMILARFANKTDAFVYGAKMLEARLYEDGKLHCAKDSRIGKNAWFEPDELAARLAKLPPHAKYKL